MLYDRCAFDHDAAERLAEHLVTLVSGFLADARKEVGSLELLTPPERARLLECGRGTDSVEFDFQPITRLFEAQAAASPDALAVKVASAPDADPAFGGLSYGELNERANTLAWRLGSLGAGRQSIVGVCVERSIDMIVAVLAILKSGAGLPSIGPGLSRNG